MKVTFTDAQLEQAVEAVKANFPGEWDQLLTILVGYKLELVVELSRKFDLLGGDEGRESVSYLMEQALLYGEESLRYARGIRRALTDLPFVANADDPFIALRFLEIQFKSKIKDEFLQREFGKITTK